MIYRSKPFLFLLLNAISDDNEFFSNETSDSKVKLVSGISIVTQVRNLQQKKEKASSKNANNSQIEEVKQSNKNDELKALELYLSRTAKIANVYAILNGNEDTTFIYGFISHSPTKFVYKELTKFRKRTTYMELLVYYLHKAVTEDLITEIREWCNDTADWLVRRNTAILGNRAVIVKKPGGVITVAGNLQLSSSLGDFDDKKGLKTSTSSIGNFTSFKKRKIKKYKLLIPLELQGEEKVKLEDRQKGAIDKIYELFPDMHENWVRRKRLRRLLQEEATYKAEFYNIWALNEFSSLMNRLNQSSEQNLEKIFRNDYVDPQNFLFDVNNCLLVSEENRYNVEIFKLDEGEKAELLPVPPTKGKPSIPASIGLKRQSQITMSKNSKIKNSKPLSKSTSRNTKPIRSSMQGKLMDIKNTCDLLAEGFYGLDIPDDLETKSTTTGLTVTNVNASISKNQKQAVSSSQPPPSRYTNTTNRSSFVTMPSFRDIVDSIKTIFYKFNQAAVYLEIYLLILKKKFVFFFKVISHRYKEWTLLQNTCKTLCNCMNALLIWLPTVSSDNVDIRLNDIWTLTGSYLYAAADNLLDMLFCTTPLDVRLIKIKF